MKKFFTALSALAFIAIVPNTAFASSDLDLFHRLVEVKRDEQGKLTELVLKVNKGMAPTSTVASQLLNDLRKMSSRSALSAGDIQQLEESGWSKEDVKNYQAAVEKLSNREDIEAVLNNKDIGGILQWFEKELNKVFQYNVLAKPYDPGYFHERAIINKLIKKAKSLGEDALGNIPGVRAFFFLLNETISQVEGKRSYCHSAVLYFLEKNSPAELGLTSEEVALIKSSMFTASIGWADLKKLKEAKKNWPTYGTTQFTKQITKNADRAEKYGPKFGEVGAAFNYAFSPATQEGAYYIVNTQNSKSKISKKLSVAYNSKDPKAIRDFRIFMRLAQFGATFLTIPDFALDQLQGLLSSYYNGQRITEGALYAYLMSNDRTDEAKIVLQQSINPLLIYQLQ
ncbi:MAG TPA: hypothetical protein VM432_07275 [Bdellovibrionales bacterium]|nr:hypothetical protein [Bdellovibrionales bacterium]